MTVKVTSTPRQKLSREVPESSKARDTVKDVKSSFVSTGSVF